MKKTLALVALSALVLSCGEKKKEEKKEGFEITRTKEEAKPEAAAQEGVPVDMSDKGVGPVKSVSVGESVDADLAAKGEEKFKTVCTACHMVEQRMIGPALKGVTTRRSPEWIMNMILNPDGMIKEDPIAQALVKEYNNAVMLNQGLSEDEARSVLEYLRTL